MVSPSCAHRLLCKLRLLGWCLFILRMIELCVHKCTLFCTHLMEWGHVASCRCQAPSLVRKLMRRPHRSGSNADLSFLGHFFPTVLLFSRTWSCRMPMSASCWTSSRARRPTLCDLMNSTRPGASSHQLCRSLKISTSSPSHTFMAGASESHVVSSLGDLSCRILVRI